MITSPSEKSQEAMQAKTQAIPPKAREEVSPLPSGGTEGQVLTMGETEAEWADIPSQLPEGGTAGQVLTMGYTEPEWTEWDDLPKELPETLGTAGQVLTVNSGATGVEWASPAVTDQYTLVMKGVTLPAAGTYSNSGAFSSKKLYKNGVLVDAANYRDTIYGMPNGTVISLIIEDGYTAQVYRGSGTLIKYNYDNSLVYLRGTFAYKPAGASSVGNIYTVYEYWPGNDQATWGIGAGPGFTAPQA